MNDKLMLDLTVVIGIHEMLTYIQNNPGAYWKDVWENSKILRFVYPAPADQWEDNIVTILDNRVEDGYLRRDGEHYYATTKADDILAT